MVSSTDLLQLEPLNIYADFEDIQEWIERFELWFMTRQDSTTMNKVAYFLTALGKDGYKLLRNLTFPKLPGQSSFHELKNLLENHLQPANYELVERVKFRSLTQIPGEKIRDYASRLRSQAMRCNFGSSLDVILAQRFVTGINLPLVREKLWQIQDLTFQKAVEISERLANEQMGIVMPTRNGHICYHQQQQQLNRVASQPTLSRKTTLAGYRAYFQNQRGIRNPIYQSYRKLRQMACPVKEESIKVCSTSGKPSSTNGCDGYVCRGKIVTLVPSESTGYLVGPSNGPPSSKSAIIAVPDICGIDILGTRRFIDLLSDRLGLLVLMPDFFHGNPWSVSNFPPNVTELNNLLEAVGSWGNIHKDLEAAYQVLLTSGLGSNVPLGVLGFCWGGKKAIGMCSPETHVQPLSFRFAAGISLHGSWLGPDDVKHLAVPMLFMPAGDDPPIQYLKEIIDQKPFAAQCQYHTFQDQKHGFAAARSDWSNQDNVKAINHALDLSVQFFQKHLF